MSTTTDIVVHVSTVLLQSIVNCFMHVEFSQKCKLLQQLRDLLKNMKF